MKADTYHIILQSFFGTSGSILIGIIFFSTTIFSPYRSNFMFVSAGFYGSALFSLLEYKNLREQIFGMVVIFFLNLIVFQGKSISVYIIIRDLVWLSGLFLSVYLYFLFIKRNQSLKLYLRSFALALIFGILSSLSGLLLFLINTGKFPPFHFIYLIGARYGILIGAGIGLGIDFYLQNKKILFSLLKIKAE